MFRGYLEGKLYCSYLAWKEAIKKAKERVGHEGCVSKRGI